MSSCSITFRKYLRLTLAMLLVALSRIPCRSLFLRIPNTYLTQVTRLPKFPPLQSRPYCSSKRPSSPSSSCRLVNNNSSIMPSVQDLRVHGPLVISEGSILIFICSVMVFLRFYARRISGSSLGLDDLAIAAALVSLSVHRLDFDLSIIDSTYRTVAFCGWNGDYTHCRFADPAIPPGHNVHRAVETGLKGLGYPSSVGDAGRDHPDANVVSTLLSSV